MNRLLQSRAARSGAVDGSPWLQDEYAAHVAALDREERAAGVYRECAHRIAPRG